MNYIWTIQKKSVVDIINSKGVYYPDFYYKKSRCNEAYQFVLDNFNRINNCNYKGLVFGFAKRGKEQYFQSIDELYKYFIENPLVTDAFNLWNEEYVILQLQYNNNFNMLPVDFNYFIQIMPPILDRIAYDTICSMISQGVHIGGYTLPSFTQIHVPFIKKENIVKVYGNFNKINSDNTGVINTFSL